MEKKNELQEKKCKGECWKRKQTTLSKKKELRISTQKGINKIIKKIKQTQKRKVKKLSQAKLS